MKNQQPIRLYRCHTENCCPQVDFVDGLVTVTDPHKPENGSFTCSAEEWNELLETAEFAPTPKQFDESIERDDYEY